MIGPRYQLFEVLGRGATGVVHRARDRLLGIDVALKQVTAERIDIGLAHETTTSTGTLSGTGTPGTSTRAGSGSTTGPDAEHVALAREFSLLSSLRHPNIISVLDYGFDTEARPYYTMELLESPSNLLEAGEAVDREGKAQLVMQMLQALSYLHRRGVVHRDLKPGNVMVVDGQVKLVDFGIAQHRDQSETQREDARISGTILYLAPECLEGYLATEASDIYAVGLMAHELFAGEHPLAGRSVAEIVSSFRTDVHVSYELEPRLRRVLRRMLARDPDLRHHQASEAAFDLEVALELPESESQEHRDSFLQAAKFVGRDAEIYTLSRRLREALKGHGSVVLVGGESGVGKSRLLDELRTLALVQGAAVTGGGAAPGVRPVVLWHRVVRWLVMAAGLDEESAVRLIDIVPNLDDLLAEQFPNSFAAPDLSRSSGSFPNLRKVLDGLVEILDDLFSRQPQPLLILLEDLHWADPMDLELLARLKPTLEVLPILVVGTYRDDETPRLPATIPDVETVSLERFDQKAIAELAESVLGPTGREGWLVKFLERETEGNVFFVVEVIRALSEEVGRLDQVSVDLSDSRVPESVFTGGIRHLMDHRLRKIGETERHILELAATYSRIIDLGLLTHAYPLHDLATWVRQCADAAVLENRGGRWRFTHDKLREAILRRLDADDQRLLHKMLVSVLEDYYADDPDKEVALERHRKVAGA